MAKANTTSVTAFENKKIEGATKSAPSEKKRTSKPTDGALNSLCNYMRKKFTELGYGTVGDEEFVKVLKKELGESRICESDCGPLRISYQFSPKGVSVNDSVVISYTEFVHRMNGFALLQHWAMDDYFDKADKLKADKKAAKTEQAATKAEKAESDSKPQTVKKAEIILPENTSVVIATKEQVNEHLKALDDAVKSFEKTFFRIGLELYWFYETQSYVEIEGKEYANVADFAKSRYGISKATTYQYIKVYDKFGERNANGDCIGISPNYAAYTSTQLIVMSQMDDTTIKKCTPDQKICEMKALLKGISENDDDGDENDGDNGNGDNGDERKPFNTIKKANTQELYSISSVEELEKLKNEIFETIRKTVGTGVNGVKYGVSVVMTW